MSTRILSMMTRRIAPGHSEGLPLGARLLCLAAILGSLAHPALAGESYVVDPRHSRPVFLVDHLGFSTQHGRFNELRGSVELDRAALSGSIDITIEASSVDMGAEDWNEHMRGKDFFNVEEFPTVIFRAETMVFDGDRPVAAEGRLAMLGEVRPLTLKIDRFRCAVELSTRRRKCGADVSATLKRSDFGMKKYVPFVGDEIQLRIPVEAYLVEP